MDFRSDTCDTSRVFLTDVLGQWAFGAFFLLERHAHIFHQGQAVGFLGEDDGSG